MGLCSGAWRMRVSAVLTQDSTSPHVGSQESPSSPPAVPHSVCPYGLWPAASPTQQQPAASPLFGSSPVSPAAAPQQQLDSPAVSSGSLLERLRSGPRLSQAAPPQQQAESPGVSSDSLLERVQSGVQHSQAAGPPPAAAPGEAAGREATASPFSWPPPGEVSISCPSTPPLLPAKGEHQLSALLPVVLGP